MLHYNEWILVGSLVGLLVGKSYHTKQKDGYSLQTNDSTNNSINWIWMSIMRHISILALLNP